MMAIVGLACLSPVLADWAPISGVLSGLYLQTMATTTGLRLPMSRMNEASLWAKLVAKTAFERWGIGQFQKFGTTSGAREDCHVYGGRFQLAYLGMSEIRFKFKEVQFQAKILAERCTQKDTSYGSPMELLPIDQQWLDSWTAALRPSGSLEESKEIGTKMGLHLPPPNPFIPEDLNLKPAPADNKAVPQLFSDELPVCIFDRQDDLFKHPKADVTFYIYSHYFHKDVTCCLKTALWCQCVEEGRAKNVARSSSPAVPTCTNCLEMLNTSSSSLSWKFLFMWVAGKTAMTAVLSTSPAIALAAAGPRLAVWRKSGAPSFSAHDQGQVEKLICGNERRQRAGSQRFDAGSGEWQRPHCVAS